MAEVWNYYEANMLTRLPHIGEKVFDFLDNRSIIRCKEASRTWYDFINEQKSTWIRMIKKYVKESNEAYTECPKHWRQLFSRINSKEVFKLACKIHNYVLDNIRMDCKTLSHKGKGLTPLHFATMFSQSIDLETIRNIIEVSTVKNPRDIEGNTPLHLAARKGDLKVFLLIQEKADYINPKNDHSNTPLHRAALFNRNADTGGMKIVEFILGNVIEKTPVNIIGKTPLHYVCNSWKF